MAALLVERQFDTEPGYAVKINIMDETHSSLVCARCAEIQTSCCEINPGEDGLLFPLFPEEVERICKYTGREDWVVNEPNVDRFAAVMKRAFPHDAAAVEAIFASTENHQRLGLTKDGVCVFIGEKGCTLPRNVRPYHCRLFPLWMRGKRIMVLEAVCLARREAKSLDQLLESIRTDRAEIRETFRLLRKSWGLPPV